MAVKPVNEATMEKVIELFQKVDAKIDKLGEKLTGIESRIALVELNLKWVITIGGFILVGVLWPIAKALLGF